MEGLLNYYTADSFIHRLNPTLKLAGIMVLVVAVTMAFDPWTPLAFLILGLFMLRILARVPIRQFVKPLLLFLVLGALGFISANAFFYTPLPGRPVTILWQAGGVRIILEGIWVGISLTLRMLAIVTFSILFVATTDPTDFVLSLIQQARFPFRLGYGILVAYRFLPMWRTELEIIRAAHRIRGAGERPTLHGRWEQLQRYAVPLLASAIRKSERVAIAMDSKAFGAQSRRTYYRDVHVRRSDWLFLAGCVLAAAAIVWGMAKLGLLEGYGVVPEA
ncbi:MAG: energy-coupling factor transporter transmembrane component T family protein [Anaerolineae bacterium]